MIDPNADQKQYPFFIDGVLTPPARSALAILNTEAVELDQRGSAAVLRDALKTHADDADLSTVYGRRVSGDEMKAAAEALADPEQRAVAELLDFPSYDIDLGDLGDLAQALDEHAQSFSTTPECDNLGLMARLLDTVVGELKLAAPPEPSFEPPELPHLKDILKGF